MSPSWAFPSWFQPNRIFSDKESRDAFKLQDDLDQKSRLLEKSQTLLNDCLKESLRLECELQIARTGFPTSKAVARMRAAQKKRKPKVKLQTPDQQKEIAKLQEKSAQLNLKIRELKEKHSDLQQQFNVAYNAHSVASALSKTRSVLKATDKLFNQTIPRQQQRTKEREKVLKDMETKSLARLKQTVNFRSTGSLKNARNAFDKLEKIVSEREAAAQKAVFERAASQLAERDKQQEEQLTAQLTKAERALVSLFVSARAWIRSIDPSVERAYKRLEKQLEAARKSAQSSTQVEQKLEEQIEKCHQVAEKFQQKVEFFAEQEQMDHLHNVSVARRDSAQSATEDLSTALSIHKRKNLSISNTLFRAAGIARRLYFIKLLLSALPTYVKSEALEFIELVDSICSYLASTMGVATKQSKAANSNGSANFTDRLVDLEQKTLLAYIRFAKENFQPKTPLAADLVLKITPIFTIIEEEQTNSKVEFDYWKKLVEKASQEQMDLLQAVAIQRSEHYSSLLRMTEQTIEVLTVCRDLAQPNSDQEDCHR